MGPRRERQAPSKARLADPRFSPPPRSRPRLPRSSSSRSRSRLRAHRHAQRGGRPAEAVRPLFDRTELLRQGRRSRATAEPPRGKPQQTAFAGVTGTFGHDPYMVRPNPGASTCGQDRSVALAGTGSGCGSGCRPDVGSRPAATSRYVAFPALPPSPPDECGAVFTAFKDMTARCATERPGFVPLRGHAIVDGGRRRRRRRAPAAAVYVARHRHDPRQQKSDSRRRHRFRICGGHDEHVRRHASG